MNAPSLREIANALGGEVRGNRACFPTPGHSVRDRGSWASLEPSAPDGVLIHCSNGGDPLAIKDILRDAGILAPLVPKRQCALGPATTREPTVEETRGSPQFGAKYRNDFDFVDQHDEIPYRKHRIEPGYEGRSKSFAYDRPTSNGGYNPARERSSLYRLPDLVSAPRGMAIFMAEEAKADKLAGACSLRH